MTNLERSKLLAAFDSGWISSQGDFILDFEKQFANKFGMKYGIATSSCTTALHLSLVCFGIGPGDEVICPDLTFIAPANMVALTGAKPILVDVDPDTWNIDIDALKSAITQKTKAIIVVHAFGIPAKIDLIINIAKQFNIKVIEDNAESPGALYKGKLAGSFGDISCFSFFANKIITTGEGGMILTNSETIYNFCKELRDHGMSRSKRYHHIALGFNYRMTNLQASIGLAQLERMDKIIELRDEQERIYISFFSGAPGIKLRNFQPNIKSVHWLFTITLSDESTRNHMLKYLKSHGVDCRQMVNPVHEAIHFAKEYDSSHYPVAVSISKRSLHLPSSTSLTHQDLTFISNIVLNGLNERI